MIKFKLDIYNPSLATSTLGTISYRTLKMIRLVILFDLFLMTLPWSTLACPTDICFCDDEGDEHSITCSEIHLNQIPTFYPENITYNSLDLGKNKIRAIKAKAFEDLLVKRIKIIRNEVHIDVNQKAFRGLGDVLEWLQMRRSHIKSLPRGLFKKMKKLKTIDLSGNKITRLSNGMFRGARNVQILDLRHNKIMYIDPGAFVGLRKLSKLSLGNNKISIMDQSTFNGLPKLDELGLSHNQIRDLQPNTFLKVSRMTMLDLSDNKIPALFPSMLKGTGQLEELILSDNLIMWIADEAFSEMSHLKKLTLSRCRLTYLKAKMFKGLDMLESLGMNGNNLTFLKDGTFNYLTQLQELWLDNNKLGTLNPCAFYNIKKVKKISVFGNKIECSCEMRWAGQVPSNTDVRGKCMGPTILRGQEIKAPANYENCKKKMHKCPKIKQDQTDENKTEWKKRRRRIYRA